MSSSQLERDNSPTPSNDQTQNLTLNEIMAFHYLLDGSISNQ